MHKCVREALKTAWPSGRTQLSRSGKFWPHRDAATAGDGLCPDAVSDWRAGGDRARGRRRTEAREAARYALQPGGKEAPLADAIARAVRDFDPALILVGLAGSELIRAGQHYKLITRQEVFADRGYLADGSPVPRSQPGRLSTAKSRRWRRRWKWCSIIGYAVSPVNGRTLLPTPCVFTVTVNMRWILHAVCARLCRTQYSG